MFLVLFQSVMFTNDSVFTLQVGLDDYALN